ncbi:hypothetical protein [Streptomyces sp. NPDC093093]|uniref:hypothetical protein n=1 Tax=Streptomyces sp. NPDC093093 TaxID=3366025 RepID=UPI0038203960
MRVRDLIRRFRGDQARAASVIAGQAVKIRDLEAKVTEAEAAVFKLMRGGGEESARIEYLERLLTRQVETIRQLRAGVADDAQTAELRRQINDLRTANKALHTTVEILTAANSGIRRIEAAA